MWVSFCCIHHQITVHVHLGRVLPVPPPPLPFNTELFIVYRSRPALPGPFIALGGIGRLLAWLSRSCWSKCKCKTHKQRLSAAVVPAQGDAEKTAAREATNEDGGSQKPSPLTLKRFETLHAQDYVSQQSAEHEQRLEQQVAAQGKSIAQLTLSVSTVKDVLFLVRNTVEMSLHPTRPRDGAGSEQAPARTVEEVIADNQKPRLLPQVYIEKSQRLLRKMDNISPDWSQASPLYQPSASLPSRPTEGGIGALLPSCYGKIPMEAGLPRNPFMRTGVTGKGSLKIWGPNLTVDAIITRWRRDPVTQAILERDGKRVLEVLSKLRRDGTWSVPGTFRDDKTIEDNVRKLLMVKVIYNLNDVEEKSALELYERQWVSKDTQDDHGPKTKAGQLLELIEKAKTVLPQIYSHDPRNTDNAWIETTAVHIHDDNNLGIEWPLRGDMQWLMAHKGMELFASHAALVEMAAIKKDAYW